MEKRPFITKEKLEMICAQYPTPFHIYDEAGIRANAKRLKEAYGHHKDRFHAGNAVQENAVAGQA